MIEEPEISLHPEAQVQLVRMLSDAVAIGQQVIITTHSQTLLLALSEAARSISPADVSIYHLARGSEGAAAKKLSLDSNWSLPGWVPSFSKVEKELLKKWIVKVDDELAKEDR
jgi:predicted ATPase